jgi:hypothetical protein
MATCRLGPISGQEGTEHNNYRYDGARAFHQTSS